MNKNNSKKSKVMLGWMMALSMYSALGHAEWVKSIWSELSPSLSAYPDVTATITGGSGQIALTSLICFTNATCQFPNIAASNVEGNAFSYTSGNTYRANLASFYQDLIDNNCASVLLRIYDNGGFPANEATSQCMTVTCNADPDCVFTPSSITLAF